MSPRREFLAFALILAVAVGLFFADTLAGGRRLSPADVLRASASFRDERGPLYEPANRLLMDPVLQFEPWLEFNRVMIRRGRLPLWNPYAGCGAPHLANGQSAVFDPFHALVYLSPRDSSELRGMVAALRLWFAGVGMFLLARRWGYGGWGRWFAGLCYPFCGFLIVWLLYPVTGVAIWLPWHVLACDRLVQSPTPAGVGGLATTTALVLLGGHVQTSAHVLLAGGLYMLWMAGPLSLAARPRASLLAWCLGIGLGVGVGAIEVVPLGFYLSRSPVWADRARELRPPWRLSRPRLLDSVCTALPYAYGSQRRGHPHLGRALGVHNLNESAGGFAGLPTLAWLAPLGAVACRRDRRSRFLCGLVVVGWSGAFAWPPVDNLLRALPVLDVTDNRRLTLWVAFGLILLGGRGIDALSRSATTAVERWGRPAWIAAALALAVASWGVSTAQATLKSRSRAHYEGLAAANPDLDPALYRARADQQVGNALAFLPRYYALAAAELLGLALLATVGARGRANATAAQAALLCLTLADLFSFGRGLNPAIPAADDHPESPLISYLRRNAPPPSRIVGIGEELPPNVLMRHGLSDPRNYDSIEVARSLAWFHPLYESTTAARTSRREITWDGVIRSAGRLRDASVAAVVAATAPPPGAFARVAAIGDVFVAWIDATPWAAPLTCSRPSTAATVAGRIMILTNCSHQETFVFRETYDPGWRATIDGRPAPLRSHAGTFLAVSAPAGPHRIALRYDPPEVRASLWMSLGAAAATVFALTGSRAFRSTRILADGLGRTRAAELESVSSSSTAKY